MPLEVQPEHLHLRHKGRATNRNDVAAILFALDRAHQSSPGLGAEGAARLDPAILTRADGALVDEGLVRRANRDHREQRSTADERHRENGDQSPPRQQARTLADDGGTERRHREQTCWVHRIAESDDVGDQHEKSIRPASGLEIQPHEHEPRREREARQRHRVHLLHYDALIPHREGRRAKHGSDGGSGETRAVGRDAFAKDAFGAQEPEAGGDRAAQRRQNVDPHDAASGGSPRAPLRGNAGSLDCTPRSAVPLTDQ